MCQRKDLCNEEIMDEKDGRLNKQTIILQSKWFLPTTFSLLPEVFLV